MPMGLEGRRWCRLLLIVLLVLPIPAAIGTYADDGGMVVSEPAETDENRLRIAAGVLADFAGILPTPTFAGPVGRPDPGDPVVTGWTCLGPTDRAPPRA